LTCNVAVDDAGTDADADPDATGADPVVEAAGAEPPGLVPHPAIPKANRAAAASARRLFNVWDLSVVWW
jgi:hypothetical protein